MKFQTATLYAAAVAGVMLSAGVAAAAELSPPQSADRLIVSAMGSAVMAVPMTDAEMGAIRGAGFSSSFLSTLLPALPPQNTVGAQVGSSAPVVNSGAGPQTFALSTPTVTINLLATNPSSSPPISQTKTQSFLTTQGFTRSFSFRF